MIRRAEIEARSMVRPTHSRARRPATPGRSSLPSRDRDRRNPRALRRIPGWARSAYVLLAGGFSGAGWERGYRGWGAAGSGGGGGSGGTGMIQSPIVPLLWFDEVSVAEVNELLVAWGHRMGAINRPNFTADLAHVLVHRSEGPVVAVVSSTLIQDAVAGGLPHLNRANTIELSRLCAARPGLCRVGLRLWREFVFPALGKEFAISYQDADLHSGATYRFDGWGRAPKIAHSGTDARSGRKGRDKWVWVWPASGAKP